MKNTLSLFLYGMLMVSLLPLEINAQIPSGNPYLELFPENQKHWTREFSWANVRDAMEIKGLVLDNYAIDSARFAAVTEEISREGGGVLYFSPGKYFFTFDVKLPSGVVLRGADPVQGRKATDSDYLLPTQFSFPRLNSTGKDYVDALFQNEPESVSRLRLIYTDYEPVHHIGLVNIDLNRVVIRMTNHPVGEGPAAIRTQNLNSHILLLSLRLNNSALADPGIPTPVQIEHSHDWQRWPWKEAGSINLTAWKNAAIANCLINDEPSDNFRQNDYMLDDGMTFDGFDAQFKFTDHPAIMVNFSLPEKGAISKNIQQVQVHHNKIFITDGHPAIQTGLGVNDQEENQVLIISEKQNEIENGRKAKGMAYHLFYQDEKATSLNRYTNEWGESLPYHLIAPREVKPEEKYPLVVFLHDYTTKGSEGRRHLRQFIWQLATEDARENYPAFILAPQLPESETFWHCPHNHSFTWPLQVVSNLVENTLKEYPVDPDRIYLVGIEMGADATWDMVINYPGRFAALAAFGGFFRFNKFSARQAAQVPMWVAWGEEDEWAPIQQRRLMTMDMRLARATVEVKQLPKTGKKCWNNLHRDMPEFLPWLFAQRKEAERN